MFKWIAALALVLLLAIAGGLFYLYQSLDGIVKAAIEDNGSRATGTAVSIESVEVSLLDGDGVFRGLKIANPPGFEQPNALEAEVIRATIDTSTVRERPIKVKEISIESMTIHYEPRPGGSNLELLKRNVERYTAVLRRRGARDNVGDDEPRVVIENLYIRDASVDVRLPIVKIRRTVRLPEIHLKNVGEKGSGATPGELAAVILSQILRHAIEKAGSGWGRRLGAHLPGQERIDSPVRAWPASRESRT